MALDVENNENQEILAAQHSCEQDSLTTQIAVQIALSELDELDRELLLLRYVNEVPVSVISSVLGISRFSVYRKLMQATKTFKTKYGKEDYV